MKTAKLMTYQMWGNPEITVVQLSHRGQLLAAFDGHRSELTALLGKAHTWAKNQGFTHITVHI
jgi:hypothetical protein